MFNWQSDQVQQFVYCTMISKNVTDLRVIIYIIISQCWKIGIVFFKKNTPKFYRIRNIDKKSSCLFLGNFLGSQSG
jgi:hypothetical protein